MDKSSQIDLLRKEHSHAIENFDFDKAEMIDQQIKRLQKEIKRGNSSLLNEISQAEIEEEREKVRGESAQQNALMMQERIKIQKRFHERFQQLQEVHTRQTTDLTYQHTTILEKEMSRAVPEADKLFELSKALGRDHQYAQARTTYKEGQDLKTIELEKRRAKCSQQFEKQMKKLKEQQEKEMALLSEKQEAALAQLTHRTENKEALLSMKLKVKELKANNRNQEKKTNFSYKGGRKLSSSQSFHSTIN